MSAHLPDLQAVTIRASTLLDEATGRILVFGSASMIDDLRKSLAAAHLRGCLTEVICATPVAGIRGNFTIVPESVAPTRSFLQLVVDGEYWLLASAPDQAGESAGCWGRQRPVAAALTATLDTLRRTGIHRAEMAAAGGFTGPDVLCRSRKNRPLP